MKKEKIIYCYKIEHLENAKAAEKKISILEGVNSAEIRDGALYYEISEWANEYDILTQSMAIVEELGGELIVSDDNEITTPLEDSAAESVTENAKPDANQEDNSNVEENPSNIEENVDNRAISEDVEEEKPEISLDDKKKRLKNDIISRVIELSLATVLLILGMVIKNPSSAPISLNSIFLIFGFAICVYEIFYFAFVAVIKKRFYESSLSIAIAALSMILFGYLAEALACALFFSIYKAVKEYSARFRSLKYEEIGEEQPASLKTSKLTIICGFISLIVAAMSFFCLIPALKMASLMPYVFAVVIASAIFTEVFNSDSVKNALVSGKSQLIDLNGDLAIKKLASGNAFEISSDVLVSSDGTLKDDAIGAMKELMFLGAKSLKTNFVGDVNEEVKQQIDFVDKEFSGKKVVTVGKNGCDVNFAAEKTETVTVKGDATALLPRAYKLAKRAHKSNVASNLLSLVAALPAFVCFATAALAGAYFLRIWLGVGGLAILAVSELITLINLKKN